MSSLKLFLYQNQVFNGNTVANWIRNGTTHWKNKLKEEGTTIYSFRSGRVKTRTGLFPVFEIIILEEYERRRLNRLDRSVWKLSRAGKKLWETYYASHQVMVDLVLKKANRDGFYCSESYIRKVMAKRGKKTHNVTSERSGKSYDDYINKLKPWLADIGKTF